jgi:hypothetical protein
VMKGAGAFWLKSPAFARSTSSIRRSVHTSKIWRSMVSFDNFPLLISCDHLPASMIFSSSTRCYSHTRSVADEDEIKRRAKDVNIPLDRLVSSSILNSLYETTFL